MANWKAVVKKNVIYRTLWCGAILKGASFVYAASYLWPSDSLNELEYIVSLSIVVS